MVADNEWAPSISTDWVGHGLAKSQLKHIFLRRTLYKKICNIFRPNTGLLSSFQSMQRYSCGYLFLSPWISGDRIYCIFLCLVLSRVNLRWKLELNWKWVSLKERFEIGTSYHLYREPWETPHSSVAVQPDAHRPVTHDSQPVSI